MIPGIFASNQGMVGDRKGDFANMILETEPTGTALMLALTSGMQQRPATDTVFNWFEDEHVSGNVAIVSGGTTTTIVVSDGSGFIPGTTAMVMETGEHVYVTASANNSLTVIRGFSGTNIVAVTNVMKLQRIGNAQVEGSNMPQAVSQQGMARNNYVQIFRNSWALTGTADAVGWVTSNKTARNKKQCSTYHAEDMERSFVWGRKGVSVIDGRQLRTTDGVEAQIQQYGGKLLSAASGGTPGQLSHKDLNDYLEQVFRSNVKGQPNERNSIGGNNLIKAINEMAMKDGTYNISVNETKYGIKVTEVITPFGTLKHMTHPLMNENAIWRAMAYVIHPGGIRRRVLRDTKPTDYTGGQRIAGVDADQGLLTTEVGIEVGAANVMGVISNVQSGIAS